jgi:hypothetical protein
MKNLIPSVTFIISASTAMADQCQGLQQKEAERAVMLLQNGATIIDQCEPCGEKAGQPTVVRSIELGSFSLGSDIYTTFKVNGIEKDMAYTYVKVAPKTYVNIAKAIACSTLNPDTVSTFINK